MKQLSYLIVLAILSGIIFSCNGPLKHSGLESTSKILIYDNGVNIAYIDTGKGDTTLLFVHGWCINRTYWNNQIAYFSKKYRVVAIDLPGFGESGKNRSDWSTRMFGNDVDSVIKQLSLKNVILVGHSMAGDIVLQAAIDNPTKVMGLVGVDNFKNVGRIETAQSKADFANAVEELGKHFKKIAFDYFNQDLFSKTTDTAIKKRVLNDVAHADSTIATACMKRVNDFNEVNKLREAKIKLYLINSDVHPVDSIGLIKNRISYRVLDIHGTGHFPMIEAPTEFNLLLEQVITGIKSRDRNAGVACVAYRCRCCSQHLNTTTDHKGILPYVWPPLYRIIAS